MALFSRLISAKMCSSQLLLIAFKINVLQLKPKQKIYTTSVLNYNETKNSLRVVKGMHLLLDAILPLQLTDSC